MVELPTSRRLILTILVVLCLVTAASVVRAEVASLDLGSSDVASGLVNSQRGDNTDGENAPATCGPAGDRREGRRNAGSADDDAPDNYFYFRVLSPGIKSSRRLTIRATFFDDPAFEAEPLRIRLHYTNETSSGPSDLPNTFAEHPVQPTLSGTGSWLTLKWELRDAGFRDFMQGTSDFRFDLIGKRACLDAVVVSAIEPPDEVLVAAHYYPWYDRDRWDYAECNAGAVRLELIPEQPPLLGRYDSASREVVDQHLRWCAEYGVNVLILEFIAPGSREDNLCRNLVLGRPASADVRFSVLYDWAIRFAGKFEVTAARIATARSDFGHLAREYFTHPSFLTVDGGRPLVMIYLTRALSGDVDGLIAAIREVCSGEGFDIFIVGDEFFFTSLPSHQKIARWDAIFGYDCYAGRGGFWSQNGSLALFRQRTAAYHQTATNAGVRFFPSCLPGFNDRAIRRTCADNPVLPRRLSSGAAHGSLFGELFGRLAMEYLDEQIPLISITSFNEWHEDTQIEPTVGGGQGTREDTSLSGEEYTGGLIHRDYGFQYLEIIRDTTLAVTGSVVAGGEPVTNATLEVVLGDETVFSRRTFTTGAYTIPRLRLEAGQAYRLRVSAPGYETVDSEVWSPGPATITDFTVDLLPPQGPVFLRGDANEDRQLDISDPIFNLGYQFLGEGAPACLAALDTNGDGSLDITDPIYSLEHQFIGRPAPPPPYPGCGVESLAPDRALPCQATPASCP